MVERVQRFKHLPRFTKIMWGLYLLVLSVAMLQPIASFDFRIYYNLTEIFHSNGADVYDGILTGEGQNYLYPPLFVMLLEPFVMVFGVYPLSLVWYGLNVAIFIYTTQLTAREFESKNLRLLLWLMPVFFFPVFNAFWHGQVTLVIYGLLVSCWIAYRRERFQLAGGLLAAAAWIKVFPAFIVIWFLLRRQWQVVRGVAIVGLALLLFQVVFGGLQPMATYLFEVLPQFSAEGQPDSNFGSHSINSFAAKLFQNTTQVEPLTHNDTLYTLTRLLLTILFVGSFGLAISQTRALHGVRFDLEFTLALTLSRLLGSHMHNYDMVLWLLAFAVTLNIARTHPQRERIALWSLLAFALITMGYPFVLGMDGASASGLVYSTPFFGAVILWGIQIALLVDLSQASASQPAQRSTHSPTNQQQQTA